MKKRKLLLITLFSVILAVVLTTAALAEDHGAVIDSGECGDNLSWTLYEDGLLEISGTGEMWDYEYYRRGTSYYTEGSSAPWDLYRQDLMMISLKLNEGITTIGDYAFYNGGFTGSLTIPNSVTSIGDSAFCGCCGFTGNLSIPDSVTKIGNSAFYFCYGFTGSLTIPNSVTSIGGEAFCGCSGFSGNLTISDSVTTIESGAFSQCFDFTGSLTIPNSVTTIGDHAFSYCSGFTGNLTIPDSVTSIGASAFYYCFNITSSNLIIPNNVNTISSPNPFAVVGVSKFETDDSRYFKAEEGILYSKDMKRLVSCPYSKTGVLSIPDSVTTISGEAFSHCNITGLNIPSSVTTIEGGAFSYCSNLTSAYFFGDAPTSFDDYVFIGCDHSFTIYYLEGKTGWTTPEWNGYPCYPVEEIPQAETEYLAVMSENPTCQYCVGDEIILYISDVKRAGDRSCYMYPEGLVLTTSDTDIIKILNRSEHDEYVEYKLRFNRTGEGLLSLTDSSHLSPTEVVFSVQNSTYYSTTIDHIPIYSYYNENLSLLSSDYNFWINDLFVADFKSTKKDDSTILNFKVYNNTSAPGVVEVYNKEGEIIKVKYIDKFENMTSVKDYVVQTAGVLYDIVTLNALNFRSDAVAKKTDIEVEVPAGGYIVITNSMVTSEFAYLVNMVDYAISCAKLCVTGIQVSASGQKNIAIEEAMAAVLKDRGTNNIIEDAGKEFSKKVLEEAVTYETPIIIYEATVQSLSDVFQHLDLDFDEIFLDFAMDYSLGFAEEVFEKGAGPAGAALKSVFGIIEMGNLIDQAFDMRSNCKSTAGVQIHIPNTESRSGLTGAEQVKVTSVEKFTSDTILQVFKVFPLPDDTQTLNNMIGKPVKDSDILTYNISLKVAGEEIQPEKPVTVYIPYDLSKSVLVYRLNDDGTMEKIDAKVVDQHIVFIVDHFCDFVIIRVSEENDYVIGDLNADGDVDATDRMILARYLAGWEGYGDRILSMDAADIDRDGDVNAKDRMILARKLAGWTGYDTYFK